MKKIINICLLWMCQLALFGQARIGDNPDYNPTNPGDPQVPEIVKTYSFSTSVTPKNAGSTNFSGTAQCVEGKSVDVRAYNNTGYQFVHWVLDDSVVATSASFNYTMPAKNVTLTAVFKYNPSNPSDPDSLGLKYDLQVVASPKQGGSFNVSSTEVQEGHSTNLYAYPNTGFRFKGWQVDGEIVSTVSPYKYMMGDKDVTITGLFEYNPNNPSNPGKNSWNETTGEVLIDDFTAGSLYSAITSAIGGSSSSYLQKVTQITVSGKMSSSDFSIANNFSNCTMVDLKRTYGYTDVPDYAYDYNTALTSIILPASIENIGYRAFYQATNLTDVTCYAITPPTVESDAFDGIAEGAVLHVLSAAIPLYAEAEGWKDFTILPLTEEVQALEVNLPAGSEDGRYKNMTLELVNAESGQKQKYVISDRVTYTFNGLLKKSLFNVYVRNSMGAVLGQIENIAIEDKDVSVTFESLLQPKNITLNVQTPDGTDVTSQAQIRWFDSADGYLQQGNKLSGLLAGTAVRYRITLPQTLGMQYVLPADSLYTIQEESNALVCTLQPLEEVTISGRVKDVTTGRALSGSTVSVSQKLNGLYSKAFTVKTDNKGVFTAKVFNDQSILNVSAADYLNQTLEFVNFNDTTFVGEVALKSITGATITTNLTYTTSVVEGGTAEVQNWYADYANVAYDIYNETQQRAITQFNVQYPSIVLLEEVAEGDLLTLTASSRTNAFVPVKATAVINAQNRAEATFDIVELGAIRATFTSTDNASVVGLLYDGKGQLVKKYTYSNASLSITNLADGEYTLVSMANSSLFNSILNLSQFAASGLKEGTDYVQNAVAVKSGVVATIANNLIPMLDESKLYYTGDNTLFSVNKTSIVAGNYLTLKGKIDFKSAYSSKVSGVSMVVDLPESCSFVENSVMVGSNISSYTLGGNRLTIPLTGKYTDQVRFCVIPTAGGDYAPNAFAQFTLDNKEVLQPIGNAKFAVKDLTISVPSTVAKTSIPISGTALGNSTIEIFDNGTKIGETTSLANGVWSTTCELDEPYNLSTHSIYAKVTTKQGLELQSETQECMYDRNAIEVKTVTMSFYNGWLKKNIEVVFDFENNKTNEISYMFYTGTDVTFVADLTNNDTTVVSDVNIYVFTDKDEVRQLSASYDSKKDKWVAISKFESNNLPINVNVDFETITKSVVEAELVTGNLNYLVEAQTEYKESLVELDSLLTLYNAERENDLLDTAKIEVIETEILNSLGLFGNDENTEVYDENKVQELLDRCDLHLQDSINFMSESFLSVPLDSINAYLEGIQYKTCEGLDSVTLLSEGFEVMEKTDGTTLYIYTSNDVVKIADLTLNTYYEINLNDAHPAVATVFSLARSESFDATMQSYINKLKDGFDRLRGYMTTIVGMFQDIEDKLVAANNLLGDDLLELDANLKHLRANNGNKFLIGMLEAKFNVLAQKAKINDGILSWLDKNVNAKGLKIGRVGGGLFAAFDLIMLQQAMVEDLNSVINLYYKIPDPCPDDESEANSLRNVVRGVGIGAGVYYGAQIAADAVSIATAITGASAAIPTAGASLSGVAVSIGLAAASLVASEVYSANFGKNLTKLENQISDLQCQEDETCPRCGKNPCECEEECPECGHKPCICEDVCPRCDKNPCECEEECPECGHKPCICEDVCPKCGKNPCECEDVCSKCGKNPCVCSPIPPIEPIHDPSGYVYEGVSSNRIEGVMASCYYKETVEDMYGDLHENIVLWDAEQYAQENPLFTDEYGMYRWDVPQGLWQVKFEKEGYQTTYSEWLPVPPPQLEVNIAMTQNKQPEVKAARAYEDGIEVEFDKYMQLDGLTTENIFVTKNGETMAGTVTLLNEEQAYEDNSATYASKVRFVPETSFLATDEVTLTVSRKVKSYAGIQMEDDYTQSFDIEKEVKSIVADSLIKVAYNGDKEITVSALPYDAAIGKKMIVKNSSSIITSISADTLTLDENGQAALTLNGDLPGTAMLTFTLADADVQASSTVQVVSPELLMTASPKATRASGTAVYRGTEVGLTCATEGAVIYYTLDGSCPCDENAPRMVYETPIAINEDMTIKAMAVVEDRDESEVAEFSFTIKTANLGMNLKKGWNWVSHNMETEIPTTALPQNATRIVGQTAELINDPIYGLVGNLNTLQPTEAYKVLMDEDVAHTMSGYEFNPATNIGLKSGWNWLGYPVNQTMSLSEAFAYMQPDNEDYIVGQDGFAQYADGIWTGTLQTLNPGMGYLYHSQSDKAFAYNGAIVSKARAVYGRGIKNETPWTVDKNKYPNVMSMIADLHVNGQKMASGNYAVGAFCGTECRGVGKYVDGKLMISIYGNGNEKITFRTMNNETEEMFDIVEQTIFAETLLGSLYQPYTLNIGGATSVSEIGTNWKVWPTVATDNLYLSLDGKTFDRVTLTDVYGHVALVKENVADGEAIRIGSLADGVYIITAVQGGDTYYKKIVKAGK